MPGSTEFPNPWVFDPRIRNQDSVYYIAREILVAVDSKPRPDSPIRNRLREIGAIQLEPDGPLARYVERWLLPLAKDGSEPDVLAEVRRLRRLDRRTRVGPNYAYAASAQPGFGAQPTVAPLANGNGQPFTGQPKLHGGAGDDPVAGPAVNPPAAGTGRAVRVAVVDTGLDPYALTLPLFAGRNGHHEPDRVYENRSAGRIGLMGGHGTVVAGIVARFAPAAFLCSVQVLSIAGTTDDHTLALGILRARDAGAEIINLSLGCLPDPGQPPLGTDSILNSLLPGTLVVAAAGNTATPQPSFYPACRPDVVSVAAYDATTTPPGPAYFSNSGPWIKACAQGVHAHSSYVSGSWMYGSVPRTFNGYVAWGGTSFATPYVTARIAAAALPNESLQATWNRLRLTLTGIPGYGLQFVAPPDFTYPPYPPANGPVTPVPVLSGAGYPAP